MYTSISMPGVRTCVSIDLRREETTVFYRVTHDPLVTHGFPIQNVTVLVNCRQIAATCRHVTRGLYIASSGASVLPLSFL